MMDRQEGFKAFIDDYYLIVANLRNDYYQGHSDFFNLSDSEGFLENCEIVDRVESEEETRYYLKINTSIIVGKEYFLVDSNNIKIVVDYRMIVKKARFDEDFAYDFEDLGVYFQRRYCEFSLWAPTASKANIVIIKRNKAYTYTLQRKEKGIFKAHIKGSYDGCYYRYQLYRSGEWIEAVDPYADSLSANGEYGVIINPKKVISEIIQVNLPDNLNKHIIYEISVRDMTSHISANVSYPSTYLGLSEKDTKSFEGLPTGLDYISDLGVTMVQIMPVYDFGSVDELKPLESYNWGYDPTHYRCLEGSYSLNPNDGYSRINEFKKMIITFHKLGLAVSLDLVYNHVFHVEADNLNKILPYYFIRMNEEGEISNGSFCGNDFESQSYMGRKYLVDCCKNWIKEYDIDAFRFDLMGIIDIDTINSIKQEAIKLKPGFQIYGEGWNMPTMLPEDKKSIITNSDSLKQIGFFSDSFRDVIKGSTSDELGLGYGSNDSSKVEAAKTVLTASFFNLENESINYDPNQVVNYVECHDNHTLWDKLSISLEHESHEQRISRQKLIIGCVLIAQGVPFIHSGMEFCRSKNGLSNTYNADDEINGINYQRLKDYYSVYLYCRSLIELRKDYQHFKLNSKEEIQEKVNFVNLEQGILLYRIEEQGVILDCFINPSYETSNYEYEKEVEVIVNGEGYLRPGYYQRVVIITPITLMVCRYEK